MKRTLWQRLRERTSSPAETRLIANPLHLEVNALLGLEVVERGDGPALSGLDWRVSAVVEYERAADAFVDYEIVGRSADDDTVIRRLRLLPLEHPDRDSGRLHMILLLQQEDEFSAANGDGAGLLAQLRRDCSQFDINGYATFYRVGDLTKPHRTIMTTATDMDLNGRVEESELVKRDVEYWDFHAQFEDGHVEYLFVELEPRNLLFRLWKGTEIDRDEIIVMGVK